MWLLGGCSFVIINTAILHFDPLTISIALSRNFVTLTFYKYKELEFSGGLCLNLCYFVSSGDNTMEVLVLFRNSHAHHFPCIAAARVARMCVCSTRTMR